MCMISPLTCLSCGNRAITVANKLQAHSVVVPGARELHSSGGTVTLWRSRNLEISVSMCVRVCVCVCVYAHTHVFV